MLSFLPFFQLFVDPPCQVGGQHAYAGAYLHHKILRPYIRSCKDRLKNAPAADSAHLPYLRRIALYLIFRYLLKSVYDGEVLGYAKFAAFSVIVISSLYRCKAAEAFARHTVPGMI